MKPWSGFISIHRLYEAAVKSLIGPTESPIAWTAKASRARRRRVATRREETGRQSGRPTFAPLSSSSSRPLWPALSMMNMVM